MIGENELHRKQTNRRRANVQKHAIIHHDGLREVSALKTQQADQMIEVMRRDTSEKLVETPRRAHNHQVAWFQQNSARF